MYFSKKTIEYMIVNLSIVFMFLGCGGSKQAVDSNTTVEDKNITLSENIKIEFTQNDMIVASQDLHDEAVDLQTLIKKTTNLDLTIVEIAPTKENYIKLSKDCETPKDGFKLSSGNDREIEICSNEKIGISYGITDLAERYLGVKWLFPSSDDLGTYYPEIHSLVIDREDRVEAPAYKNRRLSVGATKVNGKDIYMHLGEKE